MDCPGLDVFPKQSMGMVYFPTFTIKINQMQVNIPYMDGMGLFFPPCFFFGKKNGGKANSKHTPPKTHGFPPQSHGGLAQMIFRFNWVIFRFQPSIFWGSRGQ